MNMREALKIRRNGEGSNKGSLRSSHQNNSSYKDNLRFSHLNNSNHKDNLMLRNNRRRDSHRMDSRPKEDRHANNSSLNLSACNTRENHNISCGPARAMNRWEMETRVEVDFTAIYTT